MTPSDQGTAAILDFWFGEVGPDRWWVRSQDIDDAIAERFGGLWHEWRSRTPESFLGSARDAIAGVILFDQFSRNLFRHHADAFSTDPLALAIAKGALDRRLDTAMNADQLGFLYMPFQHSEVLADQDRSVALFTALGNANSFQFAHLHHDMIAKFGRFPARNVALGRANRPGEAEAAEMSRNW